MTRPSLPASRPSWGSGCDPRRIVVVGTSCSGKTTLANSLSEKLSSPHIELDAIHWLPDWVPRPSEEFRKLTFVAIAEEFWVVDGNYSNSVRDLVWPRATALVWLNYPFRVVFWQAWRRTISRITTRKELYSGNRESFSLAFFSRDSILWWVITTFHRRKREFRTIFQGGDFPHLVVIESSALPTPTGCCNRFKLMGESAVTACSLFFKQASLYPAKFAPPREPAERPAP